MTIQRRGTITTWKDDKGFGFITPNDGKTPIFFMSVILCIATHVHQQI